jgi:hypothetical protein
VGKKLQARKNRQCPILPYAISPCFAWCPGTPGQSLPQN